MKDNSNVSINRINANIDFLASTFSFNYDEKIHSKKQNFVKNNGTGVTRLAYSIEESQAFKWAKTELEKLGFECIEDSALNLHAYNKSNQTPRILLGTHLDSVRNAGKYDGTVGLISFLEALTLCRERNLSLSIPVDFVIFRAEESTVFSAAMLGSKIATGCYDLNDLKNIKFQRSKENDDFIIDDYCKSLGFSCDTTSISLFDVLLKNNLDISRSDISKNNWLIRYSPEDYLAYLEVHIEQGNILWKDSIDIGIAQCFRAPLRKQYSVKGRDDHSGATPMGTKWRQDALCATSECINVIEKICEQATQENLDIVGTVGWLTIPDMSINKIPGYCTFKLDLRSTELHVRNEVCKKIESEFFRIGQKRNVSIETVELLEDSKPISLTDDRNKNLGEIINDSIRQLDFKAKTMASGAGHDAMSVAVKGIPTCLIFIPCQDGISHSPMEYASPQSIYHSSEVLIELFTNGYFKNVAEIF